MGGKRYILPQRLDSVLESWLLEVHLYVSFLRSRRLGVENEADRPGRPGLDTEDVATRGDVWTGRWMIVNRRFEGWQSYCSRL